MSISLTLRELQLCPGNPAILRALAAEHNRVATSADAMGFSGDAYRERAAELRAEAQRIINERNESNVEV